MSKVSRDDSGVSVIVGALLLILITVIAAAGLAMIVSQAQKQQADRQALEDAINNENLKIVSIMPAYNTTMTPTGMNGSLKSIDITIQNINTEDARLRQISLNDRYAIKYHSGSHDAYDTTTEWLDIPAGKSVVIELGMNETDFQTSPTIKNTDQLKVQVSTSYYNFFDRTFKPPVASAKFDVLTENLGLVQRDYILLDGSDSISETGQIKIYQWDIQEWIPQGDYGFWNRSPLSPIITSGNKIRFTPTSNGPFKVVLTVKDNQDKSSAMIGTTMEMEIPSDPNFCPPTMLTLAYDRYNTTIVATLRDASGNPCPEKLIVFQPGSNIMVDPTTNITDDNGSTMVNVSFVGTNTGTVTVSYEKLTRNIQVTAPPSVADFTADPLTVDSGNTVQFNDTSTGSEIKSWAWDFDNDGAIDSTEQNPLYVFTNLGSTIIRKTIKLIITNFAGATDTKVKVDYITVNPAKPVPDFTYTIVNGSHTVDFHGTTTGGTPISWSWYFGDGYTGSTQDVAHTYGSVGSYNVKLVVSNQGGSNEITKPITVP